MSGSFGSAQWMYDSSFYPYKINQSLRFNDDDSSFISKTYTTSGNTRTWTYSVWFKRGNLGGNQTLFSGNEQGSVANRGLNFYLDGNNVIWARYYNGYGSNNPFNLYTDAVMRDVSAWYHLVIAFDTTQATESNRIRYYLNGVELTKNGSYPAQNWASPVNLDNSGYGAGNISIGAIIYTTPDNYYDGYFAEAHFIDGQQLTGDDFGELKNGVWVPKLYEGTYGTNGFYLDFSDSSNLGEDQSGNGNDWSASNLAATDVVLDSPTNNFATLNPLANTGGTYSEGNLKFVGPSSWSMSPSTIKLPSTGKWYAEFLLETAGQNNTYNATYGLVGLSSDYGPQSFSSANKYAFTDTAVVVDYGSTTIKTLGSAGDVIALTIDMDTGDASIFRNNSLVDSTTIADTTDLNFIYEDYNANYGQHIANFGQDSSFAGNKTAQNNADANGVGDFYYAPPEGYLALCAINLPPVVFDPSAGTLPEDNFNTVLYTGNGSTQSITGVGFQPDFAWIKSRSTTYWHVLQDSVRGVGLTLFSNNTGAETGNSGDLISQFDSDGFSINNTLNGGGNGSVNASSQTYVAWNWKAGGTAVSNTDGTITSTVSANVDAGFSIVSYTGNQIAGATVGHALSSAPELIIGKRRSESANWWIGGNVLGSTKVLYLNLTNAEETYSNPLIQNTTTATTFELGTDTNRNNNGSNYIAYCFHSVDGFSKIGTYTGNGSTDGPFVYTGFRPAFLLIKKAGGSTENWYIGDSARDPDNAVSLRLMPNLADADTATSIMPDLLSNGFKLRSAAGGVNSTVSYIYMAFAEMPFKYANAR